MLRSFGFKRCIFISVFILSIFFLGGSLSALELISLVSNGCTSNTGIIIKADKLYVYLIDDKGDLIKIKQQDVASILIYNILENPFPHLNLENEAADFLKDVEVRLEEETYQFTGWPIRFLDDTIVFYDIKGNIHLVGIPSIYRFSKSKNLDVKQFQPSAYKAYQFDFSHHLPECHFKPIAEKTSTRPVRMLSDKIKLNKFFNTYKRGFEELERFQQRTQFYARPYLYDQQTKLGVMITQEKYREELPTDFPFYFKWSSGLPYGAQGEYLLGGATSRWLPILEPVMSIQTEVKSHFLNVSFIGNPWGLSSGSSFVIENRAMFSDYFSDLAGDDALVFSQFNHMALTGVDWQAFSIASGFYYPIFGIYGKNIFREIASRESSPILRLQYTGKSNQISFITSQTHRDVNNPTEREITLIYGNEMKDYRAITSNSDTLQENISEFKLKANFIRIGWLWDYSKEVKIGLDEVIYQGEYSEVINGDAYKLDYRHWITSGYFQQNFINYLSLKTKLNYFIKQYDIQTDQNRSKQNDNGFSFSLAVEFVI